MNLDDLQSGGRLDSSGTFTVDPQKALEKLQSYQATSPRAYLLNLVSSAVKSSATRIDVSTLGQVVVFEHNGTPPENLQTDDELVFALLGAKGATLHLGGTAITVQKAQFRTSPSHEEKPFRFTFPRSRIPLGTLTPEVLDLETHCGLARCELWADGQRLNREPPYPIRTDGAYPAALSRDEEGDVEIVVRGVSYRVQVPGITGAVWADHLRKDLSQATLVQDKELTKLGRWLVAF